MDKEEFMEAIILQFAKFFRQLATYCEDNAENLANAQKSPGSKTKKPTKKKKRAKKIVDPDKPKKPLTPFFTYFMEHRERVKEGNPTFSATEVTEELGKQWKELDEATKKGYKDTFSSNFDKYKLELETYYKKKGIDPKQEKEKNKEAAAVSESESTLGKRKALTNESSELASKNDEDDDEDDSGNDSVL